MSDLNNGENLRLSGIVQHVGPFIRFFLRRWLTVLLFTVAGLLLGLLYYNVQKPRYKAECTFVLEDKQGGALGGIGGIASQFGFDLGALSGGGSIYSGENIYEVLKSKRILYKVLLSKLDSTRPAGGTLADTYIKATKLNDKWKSDPRLSGVEFSQASGGLSLKQDTALNLVYERLLKKGLIIDKAGSKGNVIKVQVEAPDRGFAILSAKRIVEEAKDLYIFIKVGNAQKNIERLQYKADSLQALLNGKSYRAAAVQVVDANPGLFTTRVPAEIAARDKTVVGTLYGEVVKNLEASKMLLAQQTPVIQVIDYPSPAISDNLIKKTVLIIAGAAAAFILVCLYQLVSYIMLNNKTQNKL